MRDSAGADWMASAAKDEAPSMVVVYPMPAGDPSRVGIAVRSGVLTWAAMCPGHVVEAISADPGHAALREYMPVMLPSGLQMSESGIRRIADHIRLYLEAKRLWGERAGEEAPPYTPESVFGGSMARGHAANVSPASPEDVNPGARWGRPVRFPSPLREPLLSEDDGLEEIVVSTFAADAPTAAGSAAILPVVSALNLPATPAVIPPASVASLEDFFVWLYKTEPSQRLQISMWAEADLPPADLEAMPLVASTAAGREAEAKFLWPLFNDYRRQNVQKIFDERRRAGAGRLAPLLDI